MSSPLLYDCIIIGGGPGGLLAAVYLARFKRKVLIIDDKQSRAALIPLSHNYPGTRKGISGNKILTELRKQVAYYKVKTVHDTIIKLTKNKKQIFTAKSGKKVYHGQKIILATGTRDIEPNMPFLKNKIKEGKLRHCIVCDGFEVRNQKAVLLGDDAHAFNEVMFLLNYTKNISLVTLGFKHQLNAKHLKELRDKKIGLYTQTVTDIIFTAKGKAKIYFDDETVLIADTIYSGLGEIPQVSLAKQLKVRMTENGKPRTDGCQKTSVSGFYAIGDVCEGLSQISVAFGHAATAACAVHRSLCKTLS